VTISGSKGMAERISRTPQANSSAGALLLPSTAASGVEVDWTEMSAAVASAVVAEEAVGVAVDDDTSESW